MCGGGLRFSHIAYLGRGERVAVHVCRNCGLAYRGAPLSDDDAGELGGRAAAGGRNSGRGRAAAGGGGGGAASRAERRKKPLPDEGGPDNPVIDEALARRLRESLGGEGD